MSVTRSGTLRVKTLVFCATLILGAATQADHPGEVGQAADDDLAGLLTQLFGGDGITLATTPVFDHSAHFRADTLEKFEELSLRVFDLSIPLTSGDGGATFVYDPVADDFVRAEGGLGTVFAERASTLGRGRISLGLNYQDISFDRLNGVSLDALTVDLHHRPVGGPGPDVCIGNAPPDCHLIELDVVRVTMDLDLDVKLTTLFASFGLTDRWDVGFIVPMLDTRLRVDARASVVEHETAVLSPGTIHGFHPDATEGDVPHSRVSGRHRGVGDLHLRSKYQLHAGPRHGLSVTAHARLPTGDADNLQGIESYGGNLGVLYSGNLAWAGGTLNPHVNLALEINAGALGQEEIDLVTGLEYTRQVGNQEVAVTLDVMATEQLNHKHGSGDTVADAIIGLRWKPGERSAMFVGLQYPLNRNSGMRADLITQLGWYVSL